MVRIFIINKHAPQYDNMKNSGKFVNYKCSKGNLKNSHAPKCGKIGTNFTLKKKFKQTKLLVEVTSDIRAEDAVPRF